MPIFTKNASVRNILLYILLSTFIVSCVHHTKCPSYANSSTNKGKRRSCPSYANSGTSNSWKRAKRAGCPTYASSTGGRVKAQKRRSCPAYSSSGGGIRAPRRQSCPAYANSSPASRSVNTRGQGNGARYSKDLSISKEGNAAGLAPWTKKAKEQDKKKATSGLLPTKK